MKKYFKLIKRYLIEIVFVLSLISAIFILITAITMPKQSIESKPGLTAAFCVLVSVAALSGTVTLFRHRI